MHISDSNKFIALLVTGLITFFWMQNGTEIVFGILVISFLFISKDRKLTSIERKYLYIFLTGLCAVILLAIVHFDLAINSTRQYFITLFKIGVFCAFMLTVDAVAFQFNHFKIDAEKFAKVLIYAVYVSIVANFIFAYFLDPNVNLSTLFLGTYQNSYLGLNLNPNHADDLFVLQITILLFCNSILLINGKRDFVILLLSSLFTLYFLYSFGVIGSRGGMLGLVAGLVIIAVLLAVKKSWKACGIYIFILIAGISITPQKNLERLTGNFSISQSVKVWEKELAVNNSVAHKPNTPEVRIKEKTIAKRIETKKVETPKCNGKEYLEKYSGDLTLDHSSSVRISLWADGINIGFQKPLFGHGQFAKHRLVDDYKSAKLCNFISFSHAHNFYIDLFLRGGAFAVVVFFGLSIALLWMLLRVLFSDNKYSLLAAPIIVHMNYLFIENIFDLTFFRTSELLNMLLCLAALCGILFALNERENIEKLGTQKGA